MCHKVHCRRIPRRKPQLPTVTSEHSTVCGIRPNPSPTATQPAASVMPSLHLMGTLANLLGNCQLSTQRKQEKHSSRKTCRHAQPCMQGCCCCCSVRLRTHAFNAAGLTHDNALLAVKLNTEYGVAQPHPWSTRRSEQVPPGPAQH
jgi:hypothetical protein